MAFPPSCLFKVKNQSFFYTLEQNPNKMQVNF